MKLNMLRLMCKKEYGEEFVEMYDMFNSGIPIGHLSETIIFLSMVGLVKNDYFTKNGHFSPIKYLKHYFRKKTK